MVVLMELRELRQLAAKNELPMNFIAKDLMISKALTLLQDAPRIVLKGGTAINRCCLKKIGKMRFSEDIDFDYDTKLSAKQAIKETDKIVKQLDIFKAVKPRIMHSTIRYDLYYVTPLGNKDKIRLEFKVKKINERYSKQVVNFGFVPFDSSLLNVYDKDTLINHKIECILGRREGKDYFDLYYLGDELKLKKAVKNQLNNALTLEKQEVKYIVNSTNPYIPRKLRPNWFMLIENLKEKLKD